MLRKWILGLLALAAVAAVVSLFLLDSQLRGGALDCALQPYVEDKAHSDVALVARAIQRNHRETRQIAALWSTLYWGFAWTAGIFSALAGLILKLESMMPDEKRKKDIAAALTACAALLVTISTSGDFQRKWQANRTASAEIESTGYRFLEHDGTDPRSYLPDLAKSLERRHFAILGSGDPPGKPGAAAHSPPHEGSTGPASGVR